MKLKAYLLNEGRSVKIKGPEAFDLIKTKCSKMYKTVKNEFTWIYRGLDIIQGDFYMVDPTKGHERESRNTTNHYTLLMDNLKAWSKYPKRGKSIICSTDVSKAKGYGYSGNTFRVFPYDNAKIGLAPERDIWDSFGYISRYFDTADGFNFHLNQEDVMDTSWAVLKKGIERLQIKVNRDRKGFYDNNNLINRYVEDYMDRGISIMDFITEILDPSINGFKIVKPGTPMPIKREVWVGNAPSVLITSIHAAKLTGK